MKSKLLRKHSTIKTLCHSHINSHVYVKSKTPYISALKRIKKMLADLQKSSAQYVVVLGMGKAVEKTLSLGCHFEQQLGKKIDIFTRTIDVLDEVVEDDTENKELDEESSIDEDDKESTLKKRSLSGVEIRIYP